MNESKVPTAAALPVSALPVTAIASGGSGHPGHRLADGNLYAWGDNNMGQLGDNTSSATR